MNKAQKGRQLVQVAVEQQASVFRCPFSQQGGDPVPQPAPNWPVAAGLQSRVSHQVAVLLQARIPGDCTRAFPTWRSRVTPSLDAAGQPESARSAIHPCLPGLSRAQFRRSGLATRAVDNIRDPTQRLLTQSGKCNEGEFSGSGGVCSSRGGRLLVRGMLQLYARPK